MTPSIGDCLFLEAGTVHAIGADLLIFEIQQTSDITFRLYDWDRIDAATGLPRQLHVEEALRCSHFAGSPCMPVQAQQQGDHEVLVDCAYFRLTRQVITQPTKVGRPGVCQGLVVLAGKGEFAGDPIRRGEVALIPAALGQALLVPTEPMTILNCSLG
jgi:mannose-6-phosphate isomerase